MINVIQLYRSIHRFEKPNYTSKNRKLFYSLSTEFVSTSGFVIDKTIYLPLNQKNNPKINHADLIIIVDYEGFNPYLMPNCNINTHKTFVFQQMNIQQTFDIFKIMKNENSKLEFFLEFLINDRSIGVPKREKHKIFELSITQPIRYQINEKTDFSLTGRKQRTFFEHDYIFKNLGQVNNIEFLDSNKIKKVKKIPLNNYKLIDERRMLK